MKKVSVKYIGNVAEDTAYDEIKQKLKEKGQSEEEASEGAGKILSASKNKEKKEEKSNLTTFKKILSQQSPLKFQYKISIENEIERIEKSERFLLEKRSESVTKGMKDRIEDARKNIINYLKKSDFENKDIINQLLKLISIE